jgi:hypothetical protein
MKIKRELKYAEWQYDDETGEILLSVIDPSDPEHPDIQRLTINRTYAFSLARFFLRIFQRMSMKKKRKSIQVEIEGDQGLQDSHDETSIL